MDVIQMKLDNMLIKLSRITQELGSLTYQVKELKESLKNKYEEA